MITEVLNVGSFFLDIAKQLYPDSKDIGSAAQVADRVKHSYNVVSTNSVHRSAGRLVMAPMIAIDRALLHQEYMQDLISVISLRDIVATLGHLALQNTVSVGVKVENLIGSISPSRGGMLSLIQGLEALDTNIKDAEPPKSNQVTVGGKTYADMMEYTPLAVGKVVNATVYGENGTKLDVPLTFRQIPVPLTDEQMRHMFGAAKIEDGLYMRWLMKRTGEITPPEWFNGTDIVKEKFKLKNGGSDYYKEAMRRDTQNKLEAVRTGIISMNTMANTIVLSHDEMVQIELNIGRKFSDPSARIKIFESLAANTIVVCNDDRGIYTFYTDGQSMPETYTRRDLAVRAKKEGSANTLEDLVKLLNGGR